MSSMHCDCSVSYAMRSSRVIIPSGWIEPRQALPNNYVELNANNLTPKAARFTY